VYLQIIQVMCIYKLYKWCLLYILQVVCTYELYQGHVLTNYTTGVYLHIIQVVRDYKLHSSLQNEFSREFELVFSLSVLRFLLFP
jgi:hypothetical protein